MSAKKKAAESLPCPFCGQPAMEREFATDDHAIGCDNEKCHINPVVFGSSRAIVIRRWNRRKP